MKTCNDRTGKDKWYHTCVEFGIAALAAVTTGHFLPGWIDAWSAVMPAWVFYLVAYLLTVLAATAAAMAVGVVKELRDAAKKGNHFCVWDLWADLKGALAGAAVGAMSVMAGLTY